MSTTISVEVRAYGHLSRFMPGGQEVIQQSLPAGSSVTELLAVLDVPDQEVWIASIAGQRAPLDAPLEDGDKVGLFPPLGGGRQ